MKLFKPALLAALLAFTACGGNDDDDTPVAPLSSAAQGQWIGSTSSGRAVQGVVLDDGTFYLMYSLPNAPAAVGGVLQGNANAASRRWSSNDAKDFNLEGEGVRTVAVEGNYATISSFGGTITYADGTSTTFQTLYDPIYGLKPSLDTIAGSYTGISTLGVSAQTATVTVAISGTVTGKVGECQINGAIEPRKEGNAYTLSVVMGPAPCPVARQTFIGLGSFDSNTRALMVVAPNLTREIGLMFRGVKPPR